ncbi:MAG TPA: hypothetical protein DGG94_13285 [Micromonosporaceae bacterium]|nr:hypothetical protein [Micromonosporaceae bacterium]HCU50750.1 hypothetical protein [Micromonosporaceae bacterium]
MYGVFRIPWSINMLGEERYQRFLAAARGEEDFVPALVEFDEALSTALQRDLRRVELMLRNAYDRTMRLLWKNETHWLIDPQSYAHCTLRRRYPKLAAAAEAGKADAATLVSNVTFGFWMQLTTTSAEQPLFVPYLKHSFNAGTGRAAVHSVVERLVRLRNRVAHHEPVIDLSLRSFVDDMVWLSEAMLPPRAMDLRANGETRKLLEEVWVPMQRRRWVTL